MEEGSPEEEKQGVEDGYEERPDGDCEGLQTACGRYFRRYEAVLDPSPTFTNNKYWLAFLPSATHPLQAQPRKGEEKGNALDVGYHIRRAFMRAPAQLGETLLELARARGGEARERRERGCDAEVEVEVERARARADGRDRGRGRAKAAPRRGRARAPFRL